jgi:biopolymer transport protein ExbD
MSAPEKGGLLKRKKKKAPRSYDAQINLVPFIDLLSVIITFMLISAVWLQLAKLDANLPTTGDGGAASASTAPEEEKFQLQVLLTKSKAIKVDRGNGLEDIASTKGPDGDTFDWTKFDLILKEVRTAHPENKDMILSADPDLEYEYVITAMDVGIANKLPNVSLAASAAKGAN